jgi:hypothetical protein
VLAKIAVEKAPPLSRCAVALPAPSFTLWSPSRRLLVASDRGLLFMDWAVIAKVLRAGVLAMPLAALCAPTAVAQFGYPASPPPAAAAAPDATMPMRNPVCLRLEGQLAAIDRGGFDPAKAEQIRRAEEAAAKQQSELDRLGQQSQRLGCQGAGFFSLFSGQSPQCIPLNNQIQQARSNLNYYLTESQRLQGNSGEREGQRRGVLTALAQNDCGPQYRQFANAGPGGFFETLFGVNPVPPSSAGIPLSGTYRTLCVRTCDGYYFPISYSTVPGKFAEDEALCRRLCPATEVALFSHRNPGEEVARAISNGGKLYSELPNAFSYRKLFNPACSCRAPGQSWAEALHQGDDQTLERGDIVVTEERARQLSQPRFDAQGKPINLDPNPTGQMPSPRNANANVGSAPLAPPGAATPAAAPAANTADEDPSKRKVRAVGPTSYPVR